MELTNKKYCLVDRKKVSIHDQAISQEYIDELCETDRQFPNVWTSFTLQHCRLHDYQQNTY